MKNELAILLQDRKELSGKLKEYESKLSDNQKEIEKFLNEYFQQQNINNEEMNGFNIKFMVFNKIHIWWWGIYDLDYQKIMEDLDADLDFLEKVWLNKDAKTFIDIDYSRL